jgi:hypothetical protein
MKSGNTESSRWWQEDQGIKKPGDAGLSKTFLLMGN